MVIKPKVRGFICTTAHPSGCAKNVRDQIRYVKSSPPIPGPKRVLIIGASTGYGLASRITAAFGCGAATIGVFFERPGSGGRTATAGWYNNAAFEKEANEAGLVFRSINGDAFSSEVKVETVAAIKELFPEGKADLVVYSLAAPRRAAPNGVTYSSVIKPVGEPFRGKTVDFHSGAVTNVTLEPASQEEIEGTIAVMGGGDWQLWIEALLEAGALADNAVTVAYSYLGPALTHAIYKDGTIGLAKEDLEEKAVVINNMLSPLGGRAYVSVNKALVTQASSAIPVVPLYISLLYRAMKDNGTHEGCIEQMCRMFARLYPSAPPYTAPETDEAGRIRMDDWEMESGIQRKIAALWESVATENLPLVGDLEGYNADFMRLFGFGRPDVDYDADFEV